jgi:hypothetical protein
MKDRQEHREGALEMEQLPITGLDLTYPSPGVTGAVGSKARRVAANEIDCLGNYLRL